MCTLNRASDEIALYTAAAFTTSHGQTDRLRRQCDLQHHRKVVGDAAGMAGAGVGAEGFLAGMDVVAGQKEGDTENAHSGSQ